MWRFFGFRGLGRGHSCSNWLWLGRCGGFILCRCDNRFCHFSFCRSGRFVFGARNAFSLCFRFCFCSSAARFCIVFCWCRVFSDLGHFNHRFSGFNHRRSSRCHSGFNHSFRCNRFANAIIYLDAATTTGLHFNSTRGSFH